MTDSQMDLVLHLLQQGDWSDAVAAYREETGADEESARNVVRQLAKQHQINPSRNWWLVGISMFASIIVLATVWYLP